MTVNGYTVGVMLLPLEMARRGATWSIQEDRTFGAKCRAESAETGAGCRDCSRPTALQRVRILGVLVLSVSTLAGCGRAGNHGLGQTFKSLASISAEAALMADDVARDRTKTTFVRVHGAELSAQ